MQVVVVWILRHAAVEERPGQVVHGVLLVLHRLGDNLRVEVVVEAVVQVGLHRQRLVQELLEEVLRTQRKQPCFFGSLETNKPKKKLERQRCGRSSHLLGALTHDDAAALVVLHGPVCFPHHLEDVVYGVIHVTDQGKESKRERNVSKTVSIFG